MSIHDIPPLVPVPGTGGSEVFTHENVADVVNSSVMFGVVVCVVVVFMLAILVFRGR